MANSLYQQMTQNVPLANNGVSEQIQSIKRMVNMLKGKPNPQQILQSMAQQNPQMAQIMNMMSSSGMSPKQMFIQIAQQQGIDSSQIINMLK